MGRMCSREGLVWISSSPWMKPSAGAAVVASPGGELEEGEEEEEGSFKLLAEDSSFGVVFVSVACWLGVVSVGGCCTAESAESS